MVIASIDIQNGKVVQLKQGAELVLERADAEALAAEFDRYGEVAVIDLDAAMNRGNNAALVEKLLRKAECRVGGGIRSADRAKELVSLGAAKVILGSAAFRTPAGQAFGVNTAFLEEVRRKIGRERVIVAVDARDGEIVVDGWKTRTGLPLVDTARSLEAYTGELLFTGVEREGCMAGIDIEPVTALREAVSCQITAAGGVSSIEEIERLAALGCDAQVGMALYTGKISLAEAFAASLNWKKDKAAGPAPMLPVIAQSTDGQVLMTGYTDAEALAETFKQGKLCFHSRTRNVLWLKGEHSGKTLNLVRLRADCDRDALLATVEPQGQVCHTGAWSCFGVDRRYTMQRLQAVIADRFANPVAGSYTATLDDRLVREKVVEEAQELCEAATHAETVWEAADLFYFATALITRAGVSVDEVLAELDRRHKK